jgi:hypothetical protein
MPKGIATTLRHGHARRDKESRAYKAWMRMRRRCEAPYSSQYKWYGARGIKVCERWHVFENFLADMGEPKTGESLDRIDNNGHYEPSNCRWATHHEQMRNTRRCRLLTVNGITKTTQEWAEQTGLHRTTIQWRMKKGYLPEEVIYKGRYAPVNNSAKPIPNRTGLQVHKGD